MKKKMFTCSMCGYVGGCRPEEEALAELKEEFGDIDKSCCEVVCDVCWEKVRPRNNPKVFDEWKSHNKAIKKLSETIIKILKKEKQHEQKAKKRNAILPK